MFIQTITLFGSILEKAGHLINGNDGGVNITYDDGDHWMKNNSTTVGQFYAINVDNEKPYNVYGGLQDNGVWKGQTILLKTIAGMLQGIIHGPRLWGETG